MAQNIELRMTRVSVAPTMMPSMMKGMALATGIRMIHTIYSPASSTIVAALGAVLSTNSPTSSRHQPI